MLTVVGQEGPQEQPEPVSLLDELVRDGAQMMLVAALLAEVEAYIDRFADVRDENGHRLVVRNGYHQERAVVTGAGAVTVTAPRVNDKRVDPVTGQRQRFRSAILPAWARKSPKVAEVLPLLYLHGLSSQDFAPAMEQFLGTGAGLSAATITRLTTQWQDEASSFAGRSLADVDFVYLWVDGIHLNVRLEQEKLCLLVMIGVRADGRKELVALTDGYRESTESWADLLRDCKRRGMRAPVLADRRRRARILGGVAGGVPGNQGAAVLVPQDGECACCAAEVGAPGGDQGDAGDLQRRGRRPRPGRGEGVRRSPTAPSSPRPSRRSPTTSTCCSEFYNYPAEHWIHLRTTNPIVIWSPSSGVLDVHDGAVRSRVLPGGRGYLPRSSTRVRGRFDVRCIRWCCPVRGMSRGRCSARTGCRSSRSSATWRS